MAVETGTVISDFNVAWPLFNGLISELDNHARLKKSILKTQFPGIDGNGFKKPILATESDLNNLVGLLSNLQVQLDDLKNGEIPIGGIIKYKGLFSAIKTNFKLCDGSNGTPNLIARFVWGTPVEADSGNIGGSADVVSRFHQHSYIHSHSGSSNTSTSHTHQVTFNANATGVSVLAGIGGSDGTRTTNPAGDHTHTFTTSSANNTISGGASGAGRNLPPYIKLAFLMRVS